MPPDRTSLPCTAKSGLNVPPRLLLEVAARSSWSIRKDSILREVTLLPPAASTACLSPAHTSSCTLSPGLPVCRSEALLGDVFGMERDVNSFHL